ncbi:Scr1 family TA system antitoxin-like transcriptional regulator [Actinokineospora soli]|uniref:Scr1 family TA system antitoxin-like transcriptional regulator n=1 Tax=Actinokineospora soli TaxID=1048753 RepID=A0ABW2THR3_9PSEU
MTALEAPEHGAHSLRKRPRISLAPSVARRLLCFELEHFVTESGVTHQTIAEWLGVTRPAVSAALAGSSLFSRPALEVLLSRLHRTEWFPRLNALLTTARRKSPELDATSGTGPRDAELVVGLEAFAEQVTVFDPWLIPPHLQTQMYAAALTKLDNDRQNRSREQRQAPLLHDHNPLMLRWLTSEHVLSRRIGSDAVMDDQRSFLLELATRDNVEVRVIPAKVELPPISPFQLVHGTRPVVVEPSRLALHYACDLGTVRHFERVVDGLIQRVLGAEESVGLIRQVPG